jgi:hypothetical protein
MSTGHGKMKLHTLLVSVFASICPCFCDVFQLISSKRHIQPEVHYVHRLLIFFLEKEKREYIY